MPKSRGQGHLVSRFLAVESAVLRFTDEGGRQLGEGAIPAEERLEVETKYVTCPYSGSRYRHQKPMNVSALKPILMAWPTVLEQAEGLKTQFYSGREANDFGSILDVLLLTEIYCGLPLQFCDLDEGVQTKALDLSVAGLFKTSLGLRFVLRRMVFQAALGRGISLSDRLDGSTLFEFLEDSLALIGGHEVCAGPTERIQEFLDVITGPRLRAKSKFNLIVPREDYPSVEGYAFLSHSLFFVRNLIAATLLSAVERFVLREAPEQSAALIKSFRQKNLVLFATRSPATIRREALRFLRRPHADLFRLDGRRRLDPVLLATLWKSLVQELENQGTLQMTSLRTRLQKTLHALGLVGDLSDVLRMPDGLEGLLACESI